MPAQDGQRAAELALDALAAEEVAEMQRWLCSGSGEAAAPPRPDMERRLALTHELATAISQAETLRQAAANLHAEHSEIATRLAAINERLEAAAIDRITEQFANQLGELRQLADQIQEKQAGVFGAVVFFRETAERMMTSRTDKATALFRRLEALAALPSPEFQPSVGAGVAKTI
jgi:hypothetical protein